MILWGSKSNILITYIYQNSYLLKMQITEIHKTLPIVVRHIMLTSPYMITYIIHNWLMNSRRDRRLQPFHFV